MNGLEGYIYVLASADQWTPETIDDLAERQGHFSHVVTQRLVPRARAAACIISCDGHGISHAAVVCSGSKVSSTQYRLTFSDFVVMHPLSVTFAELRSDLKGRRPEAAASVDTALDVKFAAVSADAWNDLLDVMTQLRPDVAEELAHLDELSRQYRNKRTDSPGYDVMAQEHDAINTALWIARVDRTQELRRRVIAPSAPMPVMQVLSGVPAAEADILDFDKGVVSPLWHEVLRSQVGATRFEKDDGSQLTVVNVNRKRVEATLGVDLLYISHKYKSFVMVQYRRMRQRARGKWEYRTDLQFDKERARMEKFVSRLLQSGTAGHIS